MKRVLLVLPLLVVHVFTAPTGLLAAEPLREKEDEPAWLRATPEAINAWQDDRFGMFVCWGPVTLTGLEIGWSRGAPRGGEFRVRQGQGATPVEVYDNLYKRWKPDAFDARAWVQLAKDAGQKYMIFLVKHHDGFCLYDTRLTDYRSTGPQSAWKHDVMADIARACHQADLKLVIYYSQPDWYHPDYRAKTHARYIEFLHGQIRELLTNYGRIDGLWFDLGGKPEDWDSRRLFKMARELQPWLVINNRCGLPGDFDTPEQRLGKFNLDRPWETCMTLGTQWSWKPDDTLKPAEDAIRALVTCAGRGGNLALNTNPMPNGQIEPRQVEAFRAIGAWLKVHGESIHGTRGGPFWPQEWGVTTNQGNNVYVHLLDYPDGPIRLPAIDRKLVSHAMLTGGTAAVQQTEEGIEINVPIEYRDELDTIIVLTFDEPVGDLRPPRPPSDSLAFGKKASASIFYRNDPTYAAEMALDDDPTTRWGCDFATLSCWLEVDLGERMTFCRTFISEPYGRVVKFQLEARGEDGQWKPFYEGRTIGEDFTATFPAVTARHVRLNLTETTGGPSIWEFRLFRDEKK